MATASEVRKRWSRQGGGADVICIKCGSGVGALQFSHSILGAPYCVSCAKDIETTELAEAKSELERVAIPNA